MIACCARRPSGCRYSVQTRARNLEFSIDKDTSKTVVKLIDAESKEVLRQFPSEEILSCRVPWMKC